MYSEDLDIKIEFNHEVTQEEFENFDVDVVVFATGATPRNLNIEGKEHVIDAIDYLRKTKEVGQTVAIIGGGFTGCEIAYDAVLDKKKPIIIEAQSEILNVPTLCAANSNMLRELIRLHEIPVYTNAKVLKVTDKAITISVDGEEKEIEVDTVVKSIGYNPSNYEDAKNFYVIGDALKVGNLMDVIWKAYDLANNLY